MSDGISDIYNGRNAYVVGREPAAPEAGQQPLFTVLLELRKEDGLYMATCPESKTVAIAESAFAAVAKLCRMLERSMIFAGENARDMDSVFTAQEASDGQ